ncbi:molybdopterin-guanine dinucleotide biosynthesis protein B [Nisaea sediminum]|uniref:molybdopterin-guanine dinucleotide biosynthesis protein B n=1 Tax=Nisaea sediminum TaxID=2775867 RepID=UPI001865CE76|nr:molybdopterin-guanine dinucleotide biosynthesis protein B [Nisaea sediminum]
MKIFGLVGWSGSGKTTLLVKLLPELVARGIRVSTMKHAHHTFDVDKPGKDSYEHREAGATEVLITSANRWALMHENRGEPEPTIEDLLPHLSSVDLLIIEGFKEHAHEKLEIFRRETGKSLLQPGDPMIRAVASDGPVEEATVPVLDLNDVPALADYILDITGLSKAA